MNLLFSVGQVAPNAYTVDSQLYRLRCRAEQILFLMGNEVHRSRSMRQKSALADCGYHVLNVISIPYLVADKEIAFSHSPGQMALDFDRIGDYMQDFATILRNLVVITTKYHDAALLDNSLLRFLRPGIHLPIWLAALRSISDTIEQLVTTQRWNDR